MDLLRPTCRRLPRDVREVIRSHTAISSVVHCVEELILNSLDAEATTITIGVNLSTFRVKVDDNGIGISPNDLATLGTRYTTSKCNGIQDLQNLKFYGYRGEALANILELSSSIEIYTRQDNVVYGRKIKTDNSTDICKVNHAKKPTRGTTVVVNNFMSKAIVRQKMIEPLVDLDEIRSRVEAIALVNPRVAILLRDEAKNSNMLQVNSCISTKDVFRQLQGSRYQMGKHVLLEISHQYDAFYFSAFISTEQAHTKQYQYFYVNKRLVDRCHFSRLLNQLLCESLGNKSKSYMKESSAPGASIEEKKKYPLFIVNVQCPVDEYDITFEPRKQMVEFKRKKVVVSAIESLVKRFKAFLASEERHDDQTIVEQKSSESKPFSRDIGKSITTHAIKRAVHSRPIVRERQQSSYFPNAELNNSKLSHDIRKNFAPFRPDDNVTSRRKIRKSPALTRKPIPESPEFNVDEDCGRLQFGTPGHANEIRRRVQPVAPCLQKQRQTNSPGYEKDSDMCARVTDKLHNMSFSVSPISTLKSTLSGSPMSVALSDVYHPVTLPENINQHSEDDLISQGVNNNSQKQHRAQKRQSQSQNYHNSQHSQLDSPEPFLTPLSHSSPKLKKRKVKSIDKDMVQREIFRLVTEGLKEAKPMLLGLSSKARLQKRMRELVPKTTNELESPIFAAKKPESGAQIRDSKQDESLIQEPTLKRGNQERSIYRTPPHFLQSKPDNSKFLFTSHDMDNYLALKSENPFERFEDCQPSSHLADNGRVLDFPGAEIGIETRQKKRESEDNPSMYFSFVNEEPNSTLYFTALDQSGMEQQTEFDKSRTLEMNLEKVENTNWESTLDCHIVRDAKGQDWLESKDPNTDRLKYVNLKKRSNIINSNTKLNPNEIALLDLNQTRGSLPVPVYGFQKKFIDKNETRNLSKYGNMDLLAAGKTTFSAPVKELIDAASSVQNTKWRFPNEAKLAGSSEVENRVCTEESEYFSEPWQNCEANASLSLLNLATNEVNLARANCSKDIVFKKEDLANVHVVGQLDNKFIIGRLFLLRDGEPLDVLVLFDQHAVHERIRLETFLNDVYEDDATLPPDGKGKKVRAVNVKPPIKINFNETELRILKNYKDDLEQFGLSTETFVDFCSIHVNRVPKCFAEKISSETISSRDETISKLTYALIQEQLSFILDTKQQNRGLPKTIFNLLCSQACHGAIKFGDNLTLEVCQDLIKSLEKCQLPFQCAHGRPAVVPLINL